jgi:hypothetical protein
MDSSIIIVLAIILLILIVLNHITIVSTTTTTSQGNCSQTTYGCCPDGINSKINFYGTNCPAYRPGPGYIPPPPPPPPQPQPQPIGGCSGTQYGCCPNNITAKVDKIGSNCLLK